MRIVVLLAVTALAIAPPAAAQGDPDAIQQSMDEAAAAAARPDDEALTCDQLQAEMMTTMNDPDLQASIAANGAIAQQQMDMAQSGRNAAMAQMGAGMAMGLASSFIPGLGYAQQAMQTAQMANMQRQAQGAQGQRDQMVANTMDMMPQLMRGQRIYELGQAKQCAFLQDQGAAPADPAG